MEVISTNRGEYDRAKRKYKANEQIKSDIRSKIFAITDKEVNAKFFKKRSAMPKTFYKLLEAKYSDKNPLNLDGDKLAEMLKIDTTILFSLMKSVEQIEEPIIETYQKFAESEAELKRLNNARHLIERINAMDVKIQPFNIIRSTIPQCIEFDMRNNILVPSVAYVKGTEKRGM
jgi:hypothetical protein